MADTNTPNEEAGMMDRIKESPRTVSALIIILIVAAAIYAFSGNPQNDGTDGQTDQAAVTTGEATDEAEDTEETATPAATDTQPQADTTAAPAQATPLPEARRTDAAFVEVAQPSEGITHLSRRAAGRWLSENQAGYNVTNEHRIFIEDYIQNRIGTKGLAIGEELPISFELVKEAVEAARNLNEQQLQNLSQYTYVLT